MKHLILTTLKLSTALLLGLALTINTASAQCIATGDQTVSGTNNVWIGYVYQGKNFETYKGYVTEGTAASPDFDQSFGGTQTNYATYRHFQCAIQAYQDIR